MKKFIKVLLIVLTIAAGGLLINQYPEFTGAIVISVGVAVLLILIIGRGGQRGGWVNSQYAQHQKSQEWVRLFELTERYSGKESLQDGATISYMVRLDGDVFTIDACLDMEECDMDVSRYDLELAAQAATEQLRQTILNEAAKLTDAQVSVQIGNID